MGHDLEWIRMDHPSTPKPWRKGTQLIFWYASESSGWKFTERNTTVVRYVNLADGAQGVHCTTNADEPRTYRLRGMFFRSAA